MPATVTIQIGATSATPYPTWAAGSWSTEPPQASHAIAPLTSRSQAFYWSRVWQEGETETLESLAEGKGKRFETGEEAIRWLLTAEDA